MQDDVRGLPLDGCTHYDVQPLTPPAHLVDPSVPPLPPERISFTIDIIPNGWVRSLIAGEQTL